jgi:hypothetical protein
MFKMVRRGVKFIFLILTVLACNPQIPTLTSQQAATVTPFDLPSTWTPGPTLTLTAASPTPTFTQTLTPTITFTPPPSRIPLPTLVDQNSFLDFISFTENSICNFPCWASIVPGQTNWDEAVFALRPMQSVADLDILTNEESTFGKANGITWYLYGGTFRVDGHFLTEKNTSLIRLSFESFSEGIPSYSIPLPKRFNLQSVLTEYGAPAMVFIYTFIHDEQGPLPFQVVLIYPENQFYIEYHRDAKLNGSNVVACDADFYLKLTVVDNKEKLISIDSIKNTTEAQDLGLQNMKPVEEVLGISPEKFHEIYSASTTECITFPINLWKP